MSEERKTATATPETDAAVQKFFQGCDTDKARLQRLIDMNNRMGGAVRNDILPQFHRETGQFLLGTIMNCYMPPLLCPGTPEKDQIQEFLLPADFAEMAQLVMDYQTRFQQHLSQNYTDSVGIPLMDHFEQDDRAGYLQRLAKQAGGHAMAIEEIGPEGTMKMLYHRNPELSDATLPEAHQKLSHLQFYPLDAIREGNTFYFIMPLHYNLMHKLLRNDAEAYKVLQAKLNGMPVTADNS